MTTGGKDEPNKVFMRIPQRTTQNVKTQNKLFYWFLDELLKGLFSSVSDLFTLHVLTP